VSPERVYDKPIIDKLGVAPGARVAVLGVADPDFRAALEAHTQDITDGAPLPGTDLIFLAADSVSRKGKAATIRDVDVIGAAKAAGLVDNKVVAFSPTHTALRLVIPRARRPATARR